jgi:hypothetical protein
MLALLFTDNLTKEIRVKRLIHTGDNTQLLIKEYQAYYNHVFGKDKFTFSIGDDTPHYKNGKYGTN